MLNNKNKELLESICKKACEEHRLENLYFAKMFGNKIHYLAGCSNKRFSKEEKLSLSKNITMFWRGKISKNELQRLVISLQSVVEKVERDF